MRREQLLQRLKGCQPVLARCGVSNFSDRLAELEKSSGVEIAKANKWLRSVERACIEEATVYKDMSPTAWKNLAMLHPGSADIRRLRKLRATVKKAWKS